MALIALALIPVVAGSARLVELSGGPTVLPENPRIDANPLPVVAHIISAIGFALLSACQFSTRLRRRHPRWHRVSGQVLVMLGLVVALSALWMTQFYAHPEDTGLLLYLFRLTFGAGMAACIVAGIAAIRQRDIDQHSAWMTRAYALALGAGTQVFTQGFGEALLGTQTLTRDLLLGSAWLINLAVAEYVIRRARPVRAKRPTTSTAGLS